MEVTLENCADEPIHIPGSIQPHGYFLALHSKDLKIYAASQNLIELTGRTPEELIDQPAETIVRKKDLKAIGKSRLSSNATNHNPEILHILTAKKERPFSAIINREGDLFLIDLEPDLPDSHNPGDLYIQSKNFVAGMTSATEDQEIFNTSVEQIRKLTGFDRVMMYRFDKQYNGQVVAESKKDGLNSFMGQHFPESDIPRQARKLYLQNPIRLIADVGEDNCPVLPADRTVNMSKSSLRSVSPIHIQYLRNMGVGASMSLSLVVDDRLWGLIACHHYGSRKVSNQIRAASVFLGQIISYLLNMKTRSDTAELEGKLQTLAAQLVEIMAHEVDFEDGLIKENQTLLELVHASGVAWNLTGELHRFGKTPPPDRIQAIINWLRNKNERIVYHTESLPKEDETFADLAEIASGILVLPLSLKHDQFMIWFRKEVIETKEWGGKPEKVIEFTDDGSHRLMPRSSFALWKETVRRTSHEWQEVEISIATKFRNSLMNYVVLKSDRLKDLNDQLETKIRERTELLNSEINSRKNTEEQLQVSLDEVKRSNSELEQFAYVASHDLQEPLRKIQAFGERLTLDADSLPENSRDYIERMIKAANRMQLLIQNLLTYSRVTTRFEPDRHIKLNDLIDSVLGDLQVLIKETKARVEYDNLGTITGDQNQLARLFQNLIQNAIKFSKPDEIPHVVIQRRNVDKGIEITIRDNGIGFDQKYGHKVFELFERLHSRMKFDGTGLGLAICKKIVERHNGKIMAESAVNEGTTIRMVFYFNGLNILD